MRTDESRASRDLRRLLDAVQHCLRESILRIHFAAPTLIRAGAETMLVRLALGLQARGHALEITCLEAVGPQAGLVIDAGIPLHAIPVPGLLPLLWSPRLARHLRIRRPTVLHVHGSPGQWVKSLRACPSGVRTVATVHGLRGDETPRVMALTRWAVRRTDVVIAVSEELRTRLAAECGVPKHTIHVIRNGIDIQRFATARRTGALRTRIGCEPQTPLVGMVGRLEDVKQPLLLVEALARVRAVLPLARLVFVGDGDLHLAVLTRARELGVEDAVTVTGSLPSLELLYPDLDVLAVPSRFEGTSLAMLEAMAAGIPVVATDVGGNSDVLDAGRCGVLVPPHDAAALADALVSVMQRAGAVLPLLTAARARVAHVFSEEAMISDYEALYA